MLTKYKQQVEAKTESNNFTWLYLYAYFNSNILYPAHLFCVRWSFASSLFSNVLFQTIIYF